MSFFFPLLRSDCSLTKIQGDNSSRLSARVSTQAYSLMGANGSDPAETAAFGVQIFFYIGELRNAKLASAGPLFFLHNLLYSIERSAT